MKVGEENVGPPEKDWNWSWQDAMNASKAERFMIGNLVFPHGPCLPLYTYVLFIHVCALSAHSLSSSILLCIQGFIFFK